MAAIDTILSQIINAKYGREVRQAIHDGIQQCYADAIIGIKGDQGTSITSVARTSGNGAEGTTDIYTITFSNNTSSTFQVRHGSKGSTGLTGDKGDKGDKGDTITSIVRTAGNGAEGTVDTYTITMSSGDTSTFQVRNGSKGSTGDTGPKGDKGDQGVSIANIVRTSGTGAEGTTDVYTITLSNGVQSTFNVRNGSKGSQGIQGPIGNTGAKGDKGDPGISITNIVRTSGTGEEGTTDIYTIYLSSGASQTFTVKHGSRGPVGATGVGIRDVRKISGTGAEGTVDTYAVMLSDGENKNFDVRHGSKGSTGSKGDPGKGVVGINKVSGTGAPGTIDTYAISYTDGTVTNFNVYNGADGAGSPTAQKLANARALTIGAVSKLFDGSEDVTWSLEELDLAQRLHTHTTSQITDFPTEMPASDVYEWAKAQTKPIYTPTEVGAASEFHNHTTSDITNFPSSMPASDVEAWAKALTKPSYTPEEVGAAPVLHNHNYSTLQDIPETFTPSLHTHDTSQITDFPTEMPPSAHDHVMADITDFDNHGHGNIENDGTIGSDSDRILVTGMGGSITTKTPAQVNALVGVSNPNILHNWDWNNPVNQRGVSGVLTNPTYFYDRWSGSGNTYTQRVEILPSGWVRIGPAQTPVSQKIEFPDRFSGLTLTYSVEVEAVTGTEVTIRISDTDGFTHFAIPPGTTGIVSVTRSITSASAMLSVLVVALEGSAATIKRHKLELGSHSTLHLDPPMDWAVELPKCQRFCYVLNGLNGQQYANLGMGWRHMVNGALFRMFLPATLRVLPSVSVLSGTVLIDGTVINSSLGVGAHTVNGADAYFAVQGLPSGTVSSPVTVTTDDYAKVMFSADL